MSDDNHQEDDLLVEPLSLAAARTLARTILREGRYAFRSHAAERLVERELSQNDVISTLRAGTCVEYVFEQGTYRYRFETQRGYCAIVVFRSVTEMVVITAWKK